jgi:stage II sporulation protein D
MLVCYRTSYHIPCYRAIEGSEIFRALTTLYKRTNFCHFKVVGLGKEPKIHVGIIDKRNEVTGRLNGSFTGNGETMTSGRFEARVSEGAVIVMSESGQACRRSPRITLHAAPGSTFSLFDVTIGKRFHWERPEDQIFLGDLILQAGDDGTLTVINEIPVEEYLESVISSEMSARAPAQFLKAHAILSRSWLLSSLERRRGPRNLPEAIIRKEGELVRWYDDDEHDFFDVCADDHCQRYHGVTKITVGEARRAVKDTRGMVVTYGGEICDTRYSKACGGLTELYSTAWDDLDIPYLASVCDGPVYHGPASCEEEAGRWIRSAPEAYCHTGDQVLLSRILPDFDRETNSFFRWTVTYSREELSEILKAKSGFDFGDVGDLIPLNRGPSGRIRRLKIQGTKMSMVVGKELEIRKWLSRSHLYSSAFVVDVERSRRGKTESFVLQGAGWGHGVGLCQIGAAVMASRGFQAEAILTHYFSGGRIEKVY